MTISIGVAGGQGLIGQGVCKALIEGGKIDRIIAFDLKTTGKIDGVEERIVDVHDKSELIDNIKDLNLVINIVAPYYRHGTIVADAALEAGIHYTDACADIEITKALLDQDEKWKEKGLTLLTGLGASPGLTNMYVKLLASRFDEVLEAHVVWATGGAEVARQEESTGTLEDFIREEFGEIPTYFNGQYVNVIGFLDGAEEIQFGEWTITVYHSGHSEPITIPRFIPGIRTVSCKGNVAPFGVTQLIQKAVDIGLDSDKRIKVAGQKISPLTFLTAYINSSKAFSYYDLESLKFPGGMQVKVVGIRNGKQETEIENLASDTVSETADMTRSTAVPIAVVSEAIALGEVKRKGAYAPEALDAELINKFLDVILNRI
jgi:saccharopine dehydrogenase-like NADP-dependent oxidoreductase